MEEYTVNRKQFHFLLVKFLEENRLLQKWFEDSVNYKRNDISRRYLYQKYKFGEGDDFSTHLYKCIDLYIAETGNYYNHCIYGFFRYIPSGGCGFGRNWDTFWSKFSRKWEEKYYFVKHEL